MDPTLCSIKSRVQKIKGTMFSQNVDPYSFVSPSAYDTAWLAMIPDSCSDESDQNLKPMFGNYLNWLINNQKEQGFWGECDAFGNPTIEALPATLASIVALKMWNTGPHVIDKGLSFIESNAEELLKDVKNHCPYWFAIVLPAMVELAETNGLQDFFPESVNETLPYIFSCRQKFLNKKTLVGQCCYAPLLSYLEALPPSFGITTDDISNNLSGDGSLFQSPAATAKAFMVTGKQECLIYLQSLTQRCPSGVPQTYPMDEDLIKLCMVNQIEKLGLAQYFVQEIDSTLAQIKKNFVDEKSWVKPYNMIASQLHKHSLAFQLLRMHGYKVSPLSFCWFLHDKDIRGHVEKHPEFFTSAMMNVYKATDIMFCGEYQLEEAKSFARKLLEKMISADRDHRPQIKYELNLPWLARLDHLEHRMFIEENEANALWKGKTSYNRISCLCNDELLQLAVQNYEFRQSLYKTELEELKRWSEDLGLRSMGFGREKTIYCYYAVAAAASFLPHDSYVRLLVAKSAIIITVADDFFDAKASLPELEHLKDAIGRWDSRGLSSHSKVIFDALDDLVSEVAQRYRQQEGADITSSLRDLWNETFDSWLEEAKWSRNGQTPSIDDYIKIGMISIAVHTIVLPASCFLSPGLLKDKLRPTHYETITKLLMVICRLLNDIQSYQKEKPEGNVNSVLISLIENPEVDMEDSIAFVREMIEKNKKEFIKHVLMDEMCDWPKTHKQFHLSCLKAFQMFFNSSNSYDSNTDLLEDIDKAIYLPLSTKLKKHVNVGTVPSVRSGLNKKYARILNSNLKWCSKSKCLSVAANQVPQYTLRNGIFGIAPKFVGGFI